MLTDTIKSTFKDAAQKLTGNRKRDFMANGLALVVLALFYVSDESKML